MFKDKRLDNVVFPDAMYWTVAQSVWGNAECRLAGQQDIAAVRAEIRALAAALGYEWVPEGKTKAEWRKKPPVMSWRNGDTVEFATNADGTGWYSKLEVEQPAHNRRKGDRKKGGRRG